MVNGNFQDAEDGVNVNIQADYSKFKNGQKILTINNLFFFLPDDFNGDMADAFEALAKYLRENYKNKSLPLLASYESACSNFLNDNKRLTCALRLSRLDKDQNKFIPLEPV